MNFVSALQLSSILKHSSISYWWEEFLWLFNMVIISMTSVICVDTWQSRKQWSIVERSVDWLKNCSSDINFNVRPIQQYIAKVKSLSVQLLSPITFIWRFLFFDLCFLSNIRMSFPYCIQNGFWWGWVLMRSPGMLRQYTAWSSPVGVHWTMGST